MIEDAPNVAREGVGVQSWPPRFVELAMISGKLSRSWVGVLFGIAFALTVMVGAALQAHAQIVEPEVEKGQRKLEAFSAFHSGLNGGAAGDTREVLALSYHRGLTEVWLFKGIVVAERPLHGDLEATAIVAENVFELQNAKKAGGIGYAWFTAIAAGINGEETNAVVFGPIVRLGAGDTSLILNPFLEQTFGRNRDEGIAFLYGWQLKHQVRSGFAVGIEGFGRVQDIGGGGGQDEHGVGPLLVFELPLADKRSLSFETGWLVGLNDTTPDHTIKFQLTYTY
jgi:hypothetical protein